MNKHLYVVEGKDDISKLSSLGCYFVLPSQGFALSYSFLTFLNAASQVRPIVIITDPDGPGRLIREKIHNGVPNCTDIILDKKKGTDINKIGLCETDSDYLRSVLEPYLKEDALSDEKEEINLKVLADNNLVGSGCQDKRSLLIKAFGLTATAPKGIVKELNILRVSEAQVKKAIEK